MATVSSTIGHDGVQRLYNMKIRDEFLCPITYELLRDPVIAADGNTYERCAIERWLKKTGTSPLSGEKLEHTMVSSNRTLKKIIQDLIAEGGVGLYVKSAEASSSSSDNGVFGAMLNAAQKKLVGIENSDIDVNSSNQMSQNHNHQKGEGDGDVVKSSDIDLTVEKPTQKMKMKFKKMLEVRPERVLVFKCVGPKEAEDWFNRTFDVGPRGCVGGRNNHGRNVAASASVSAHANPASLSSSSPSSSSGSDSETATLGQVQAQVNVDLSKSEVVTFKEDIVSRSHFEVGLIRRNTYAVRDVGSVGGTYLRVTNAGSGSGSTSRTNTNRNRGRGRDLLVPESSSDSSSDSSFSDSAVLLPVGSEKGDKGDQEEEGGGGGGGQVLRSGMIVMLGRHQFLVSRAGDNPNTNTNGNSNSKGSDRSSSNCTGDEYNEASSEAAAFHERVLALKKNGKNILSAREKRALEQEMAHLQRRMHSLEKGRGALVLTCTRIWVIG